MAWSINNPVNTTLISDVPSAIRDTNNAIEHLFEREHIKPEGTIGSGMTGGYHKSGSAKAFCQDEPPTLRADSTAFTTDDLGAIWFDTNATTDGLYILTAITPTWTPVSTAIIATLLASARTFLSTLTVDGVTTLKAGLSMLGAAGATDYQLISNVKDPVGDQDAATKKYVDAVPVWTYYGPTTPLINNAAMPTSWTEIDVSIPLGGAKRAMLFLRVDATTNPSNPSFRTKTHNMDIGLEGSDSAYGAGCTGATIDEGNMAYFMVMTDASGVIEWKNHGETTGDKATVYLYAYQLFA